MCVCVFFFNHCLFLVTCRYNFTLINVFRNCWVVDRKGEADKCFGIATLFWVFTYAVIMLGKRGNITKQKQM